VDGLVLRLLIECMIGLFRALGRAGYRNSLNGKKKECSIMSVVYKLVRAICFQFCLLQKFDIKNHVLHRTLHTTSDVLFLQSRSTVCSGLVLDTEKPLQHVDLFILQSKHSSFLDVRTNNCIIPAYLINSGMGF